MKVLQLVTVLDSWVKTLGMGVCIDVVYCDFMKAFEEVPHRRLIQIREHYGINNPMLGWIQTFLYNMKQRIIVNGQASDCQQALSGIPQGSLLGPILFVIYINTLPEAVKGSDIFLLQMTLRSTSNIY